VPAIFVLYSPLFFIFIYFSFRTIRQITGARGRTVRSLPSTGTRTAGHTREPGWWSSRHGRRPPRHGPPLPTPPASILVGKKDKKKRKKNKEENENKIKQEAERIFFPPAQKNLSRSKACRRRVLAVAQRSPRTKETELLRAKATETPETG
jgi:hypothetical protein